VRGRGQGRWVGGRERGDRERKRPASLPLDAHLGGGSTPTRMEQREADGESLGPPKRSLPRLARVGRGGHVGVRAWPVFGKPARFFGIKKKTAQGPPLRKSAREGEKQTAPLSARPAPSAPALRRQAHLVSDLITTDPGRGRRAAPEGPRPRGGARHMNGERDGASRKNRHAPSRSPQTRPAGRPTRARPHRRSGSTPQISLRHLAGGRAGRGAGDAHKKERPPLPPHAPARSPLGGRRRPTPVPVHARRLAPPRSHPSPPSNPLHLDAQAGRFQTRATACAGAPCSRSPLSAKPRICSPRELNGLVPWPSPSRPRPPPRRIAPRSHLVSQATAW
jgi:hypothetical protein